MAISIQEKEKIFVISRLDPAIENTKSDNYDEYLETLDEGLLEFEPGVTPTKFVIDLKPDYEKLKQIKRAQYSIVNGETIIKSESAIETMQLVLIGIEDGGDGLVFRTEKKSSLASTELIASLERAGILNDLWVAYIKNSRGNQKDPDRKKK